MQIAACARGGLLPLEARGSSDHNIHTLRTRTYNVVSKRGRRIKEEEEEEEKEYETKKEIEGLEEQKEEVE